MSSESKWPSFKSLFGLAANRIFSALICRPDGTVNRRLLNFLDVKSPLSATPVNGVKSFDFTVDDSRDHLWFRVFVPVPVPVPVPDNEHDHAHAQDNSSLPVLIYFHGGGFTSFSPSTKVFDVFCRRLAADIPAVVISVNYRLAPEHCYPSQYDDVFDVVKFIDGANKDKIDGFPANADLRRSFLAGDSAGGNLAHHVAVRAAGSEFETVRIRGLIAIQPFFGGEERTDSELRLGKNTWLTLKQTDFSWKAFLPDGSGRDHPASNVFGPDARDLSGLELFPPTMVVVGGKDLLQDWQRRYYDGLKRSGKEVELVEYPNVQHGFYCSPELPEFDMLVSRIGDFLHKQLELIN